MKKILFTIALLTAMIFTGCEKEESPVLSEFITGGEWVWTQIEELQSITFTGQFLTNGTYLLELTNGVLTENYDGNYSIDDDTDLLSLDQPGIEPTEIIVFEVDWEPGVEEMHWAQVGDPTNALDWTRN